MIVEELYAYKMSILFKVHYAALIVIAIIILYMIRKENMWSNEVYPGR